MISLALITCHVIDFIFTMETAHLRHQTPSQETDVVECWSELVPMLVNALLDN